MVFAGPGVGGVETLYEAQCDISVMLAGGALGDILRNALTRYHTLESTLAWSPLPTDSSCMADILSG